MSETPSPWVKDVTADAFEREVIERSHDCPVIVDFWAPWCGPCRQLGPLLETIVAEQQGAVFLAKVNTENEQELAATFGVQSIPMVVALSQGKFVDRFDGLLPEEVLRKWVTGLLPSEAEQLLERGRMRIVAAPDEAEALFRQALELDPDFAPAKIALAELRLEQGDRSESRQWIADLERRGFLEPEAEQIKSRLELEEASSEAGGLDEVRAAAEAEPDNLELQLMLVDALAVAGKYQEAFDICLHVVQRDREGQGEAARERMVRIFTTLGNQHPLVGEYRRKLATALY